MRILIDGFLIGKPRGLGRYVRELINALKLHAPDDFEIIVAIPRGTELPDFLKSDKIIYREFTRFPYPIWEQFVIPYLVFNLKADICHCPYNTIPFFRVSAKYVVTIHDLIFQDSLGQGWYQNFGNLYRRLMLKSIKHRPPVVVTVSNESASVIQRSIGLNSHVIYTPTETVGLDHCRSSEKINKAEKVLLHIGGTAVHKNTVRVIQAFKLANIAGSKLVVLGMDVSSEIAQQYMAPDTVFPGWVEDEQIVDLFSEADILIFPSLVEGYGLPIIEGFTAGVPVLTSNRPPMSEIAGDGAYLINPESVEEMAAGIRLLLSDKQLAFDMVSKGTERLSIINSRAICYDLSRVYRNMMSA